MNDHLPDPPGYVIRYVEDASGLVEVRTIVGDHLVGHYPDRRVAVLAAREHAGHHDAVTLRPAD